MASEPVFEDPNSLSSLLQRAQARRAAGGRIPDLELATIIERHRGKELPAAIIEYLTQHFRGEIKGARGPKTQSDAEKDFRFGPADNLYRRALPTFEYCAKRQKRQVSNRRVTTAANALTPSEQALDYVIEKLKDECDLGTLSTGRSLANAISERRRKIEDREFPTDQPNSHPTDGPESVPVA
jgi:hypothetical protein